MQSGWLHPNYYVQVPSWRVSLTRFSGQIFDPDAFHMTLHHISVSANLSLNKKTTEYAWCIKSETSAGMWFGKKKRVLISLYLYLAGSSVPSPVQIQKRANYSSFSPVREGLWSLLANSQSNFTQFYYSTNKIPINRYFTDKKKLVNLHRLN